MTATDLLCVVAHPDDESFGLGSLLASAASAGFRVVVVCATRGESGQDITGELHGSALGVARERELRLAAGELGVANVEVLDFVDSGWDGPPPEGALVAAGDDRVADVVGEVITRLRPKVVVTLDPTGSDGHRDHEAIGRATTAAFMRHASSSASLYHWCVTRSMMNRWTAERADAAGVYAEQLLGRPDHEITTILDTGQVLDARRRAIAAHTTQANPFEGLSPALETAFLTEDHLVRIVPPWEGGAVEHALVGLDH